MNRTLQNSAGFVSAWDLHREIDHLLHNRVASLLVAEAFLVASAIALITAEVPDYVAVSYALMVITVLGIVFTHYLISINSHLINMLTYLKNEYLSKDSLYTETFKRGGESISDSRILPIRMPRLFLYFWYAMVPECIYFAYKLHLRGAS